MDEGWHVLMMRGLEDNTSIFEVDAHCRNTFTFLYRFMVWLGAIIPHHKFGCLDTYWPSINMEYGIACFIRAKGSIIAFGELNACMRILQEDTWQSFMLHILRMQLCKLIYTSFVTLLLMKKININIESYFDKYIIVRAWLLQMASFIEWYWWFCI